MAWNMRIDSPDHSECSPPWLQPVEHSFPLSPKALSCTAGVKISTSSLDCPFPNGIFLLDSPSLQPPGSLQPAFLGIVQGPLPHTTQKKLFKTVFTLYNCSQYPHVFPWEKEDHQSSAGFLGTHRKPCGTGGSGMGSAISAGAAVSFALLGHLLSRNATADAIQDWGEWDGEGSGNVEKSLGKQKVSKNRLDSEINQNQCRNTSFNTIKYD